MQHLSMRPSGQDVMLSRGLRCSDAPMPRWCYFYEAPDYYRRRRMRGPMKNQLTRKIIKDEQQTLNTEQWTLKRVGKRKRTSATWGSGSATHSSLQPISLPHTTSKQLHRNVAPPWIRMACCAAVLPAAIANCRSHERWVKNNTNTPHTNSKESETTIVYS